MSNLRLFFFEQKVDTVGNVPFLLSLVRNETASYVPSIEAESPQKLRKKKWLVTAACVARWPRQGKPRYQQDNLTRRGYEVRERIRTAAMARAT